MSGNIGFGPGKIASWDALREWRVKVAAFLSLHSIGVLLSAVWAAPDLKAKCSFTIHVKGYSPETVVHLNSASGPAARSESLELIEGKATPPWSDCSSLTVKVAHEGKYVDSYTIEGSVSRQIDSDAPPFDRFSLASVKDKTILIVLAENPLIQFELAGAEAAVLHKGSPVASKDGRYSLKAHPRRPLEISVNCQCSVAEGAGYEVTGPNQFRFRAPGTDPRPITVRLIPTPSSTALRTFASVVLPGAGQFMAGENLTGLGLAGAALASWAYLYSAEQSLQVANSELGRFVVVPGSSLGQDLTLLNYLNYRERVRLQNGAADRVSRARAYTALLHALSAGGVLLGSEKGGAHFMPQSGGVAAGFMMAVDW